MSLSIQDYKNVMRHTASGVVVISTIDSNGEMFGFTANSFTSLALHPPMVLFCINNNARSLKPLQNSLKFSVSVLSDMQQEISRNFAVHDLKKFDKVDFDIGPQSGCPLIKNSVCLLECTVTHQYPGGDHTIVIGLVDTAKVNKDFDPLVYYSGSYRKLEIE